MLQIFSDTLTIQYICLSVYLFFLYYCFISLFLSAYISLLFFSFSLIFSNVIYISLSLSLFLFLCFSLILFQCNLHLSLSLSLSLSLQMSRFPLCFCVWSYFIITISSTAICLFFATVPFPQCHRKHHRYLMLI